MRTLREVKNGECVRIAELKGETGTCHRLREMGFCEEAHVEKVAGDRALICKVCDQKMVISEELARSIFVEDEKMIEIPLSGMKIGQRGVVKEMRSESEACDRIEEMGITPGEEVEVLRYAPMGDPVEVKIRGYSLSLRKDEAEMIIVSVKE